MEPSTFLYILFILLGVIAGSLLFKASRSKKNHKNTSVIHCMYIPAKHNEHNKKRIQEKKTTKGEL